MQRLAWLPVALLPFVALFSGPAAADATGDDNSGISWKKTVIDRAFRSEGVTVADVNRDGKLDILNGEMWYEAPDWKPHPIRKLGDYGDGLHGYSNSFACWADDINGDGYPDLIVIGFPGAPCHWFENPKGGTGLWKQHEIWHSACNETPQYADLFGTGKRVLVMGWQPKGKENEGQMAYFTPGSDPTQPWLMHPISPPSKPGKPVPGTFKFAHGLGIGDINGDGRLDVICNAGWWEQPAEVGDQPWTWHPAQLGADCSDMFAYDMDGDGKADVLSSSAHKFGIWWHQQIAGKDGATFVRHDLFPDLVSETHALHFEDVNGDGLKDLITGKRYWSHGMSEPGSNKPAMLYWFEAKKAADGNTSFTPHVIDNDSGIDTQFYVGDVNGDGALDVVTSNKKGTYLFEQVRAKR
jgi:FG-GAP-like repeat/FG-GAP repeat